MHSALYWLNTVIMSSPEHGEAAAEGGKKMMLELPSFLNLLGISNHTPLPGGSVHYWTPALMSLIIIIFMTTVSKMGTSNMQKVPRGLQGLLELVVGGLSNFFEGILGHAAKAHIPFLGTLFLYIIIMNFWGLIPSMHSPTNTLNTTLALGGGVFIYVQYVGIKELGGKKFLLHLADPLFLSPLMFPLHVLGELIKPVSLALRLFGNLMGEDIAIAILVGLAPYLFSFIPIPVHVVMVALALLFSTIQAVVFSLLTAIYIGQSTGSLGGGEH